MLIIPPPILRKRRKRQPPAQAVPPLAVVAVTEITVIEGGLLLTAVFNTTADRPLSDVATAVPEKWNAKYSGNYYSGASLDLLAYNRLRIGFVWTDSMAGEVLAYLADPSDITDAIGQQLAPFTTPL